MQVSKYFYGEGRSSYFSARDADLEEVWILRGILLVYSANILLEDLAH